MIAIYGMTGSQAAQLKLFNTLAFDLIVTTAN